MADDDVPGVDSEKTMTPKPRKPAARKKAAPKPAAKTTAKRKPATPKVAAAKATAAKPKRATAAKPKTSKEFASEAEPSTSTWTGAEASSMWREYASQAKDKAGEFAKLSKTRSTEAIGNLGRTVGDSGAVLDEKVGVQYGDYMRTIGKSIEEFAGQLDEKSVEELMDETREFVRKSPAMTIGAAAVAGFMLSRIFKGGNDA